MQRKRSLVQMTIIYVAPMKLDHAFVCKFGERPFSLKIKVVEITDMQFTHQEI